MCVVAHAQTLGPEAMPYGVQESPQWEEWISEAFAAFDVDGSGRLSQTALTAMLCGEVCQACPGPTLCIH